MGASVHTGGSLQIFACKPFIGLKEKYDTKVSESFTKIE